VLALLAAGLTEIVALTTVGGALLFGLLGLLAATHDADRDADLPVSTERHGGAIASNLRSYRPTRRQATVAIVALTGLVAVAFGRQLAALPFVNVGTSALYRGTLQRGLDQVDRAEALASAIRALRSAIAVDPGNLAALRNLALAEAASGQTAQARQYADQARAWVSSDNRDAIFGIGRAYAAAGAWDEAIGYWSEVGAGPQLLELGRQLVQGPDWQTGNAALIAAAQLGAPGRSAADAITRAGLARGLAPDAVVEELRPLLEAGGEDSGMVRYFAWLQAARVYRQAGQTERAERALAQAEQFGLDPQIELERALIRVAEGRLAEAEAALTWIVAHATDDQTPVGLPDGDDPRYWLAVVQLRQGHPEPALATARAGLADLSTDQDSLKGPYQGVIGESLLALGRPAEALAAFRAGLHVMPSDAALADGARRAQAAAPR
jgi:tetratricopeptide (TPR) repeat protein